MKIVIATGVYPPDIGGPAQYAFNLQKEFSAMGHRVVVLPFWLERKLPIFIRHCFYFFRLICQLHGVYLIVAMDTFSVGWPAVCAAKLFGKKIIIRAGGDFLWESYVEKTGNLIMLENFNKNLPVLSLKQKIIFKISKFVLKNANIVFSTDWQKEIFKITYDLDERKLFIIENFYGEKLSTDKPIKKNFLWAGRRLKLKNLSLLEKIFKKVVEKNNEISLDIFEKIPHGEMLEKIKDCYVIVYPSISEVSPNFILDAIRFNKPFILTKETGLFEKLKNIGVFVDPFDEGDIKNKILFLADEKNYCEQKEKIKNFNFTHSWSQIAEEFLRV